MVDLTFALPLIMSMAASDPGPRAIAELPLVKAQAIDRRVTRTSDLPTLELRDIRRRMLADQYISFDEMRRLADAGDGNAAYQYAERLLAQDDPSLRSAAALYYASAALTGRDYAVFELVKLLEDPQIDFSEGRLQHLENAMRNLALQGSQRAVDALAEFYATGEPFGRKPDEVRKIMIERAEAGDAEAAMDLVRDMMSGATEADPAQVEALLAVVREEGDLGMRAAAQSLLAQLDTAPQSDDSSEETDQ